MFITIHLHTFYMPVHGVLCISALTVAKMKGDMYNMFFWWGGGGKTHAQVGKTHACLKFSIS